jgi:methionyl-tRNA formyltransferase
MRVEKYIFVGNRRFVLEEMQSSGLKIVKVIVVKGSHLEKDLQNGLLQDLKNIEFIVNKSELLEIIRDTEFDFLISNGCPYILPIDDLPTAKYINIHPSCLPDLRGVDPVIGAVLCDREAGASCHIMDRGIDTGQIVAQVRIPMTDDLDVTLLYQLSFIAERQAFAVALSRNFKPAFSQVEKSDLVYYTRRLEDRQITFFEPNKIILRKIRAFSNRSAGCEFMIKGCIIKVYSAHVIRNTYLSKILENFEDCVIALSFENSIVFKKDGQALRFGNLVYPIEFRLSEGDLLI